MGWGFSAIIAIPLLLILLLFMAFIGRDMSRKKYTCQVCGKRFQPKWFEFLAGGYYSSNNAKLRCPHCRRRTQCSVSHDQS